MKKIFTSCLILLATGFSLLAQNKPSSDWCGTDVYPEYRDLYDTYADVSMSPEGTLDTTIYFPVKMFVISPAGATQPTMSKGVLLNILCDLSTKYNNVKFKFYMTDSISYIYNTAWSTLPSKTVGESIMSQYNVSRRINVYFTNLSGLNPPLCGYAYFPGSPQGQPTLRQGGLFMGTNGNCSSIGNTTFAHEMGHFFSLFHPFEGTSSLNKFSSAFERVTRITEVLPRLSANCSTAGDGLCDTPSDWIGTRWNCNVAQTIQTDQNGDTLRPDATLYMCYSEDACQTRFSPQQIAKMRSCAYSSAGRTYLRLNPPAWDTITTIPQHLFPANNTQLVNPNSIGFAWTSVPGATQYLLQLSRSTTFSTIDFEVVTSDTTYTFTGTNLTPNANYRWQVKPFNHVVVCAPFTQFFTFRTGFVGVENLSKDFNVYPSVVDAGQSVTLNFTTEPQTSLQAEIIDLNGRVVSSRMIENVNVKSIPMEIEGLSSGMYMIRLSAANKVYTQKIVVR